jgi:hypothetical protein
VTANDGGSSAQVDLASAVHFITARFGMAVECSPELSFTDDTDRSHSHSFYHSSRPSCLSTAASRPTRPRPSTRSYTI